MIFERKKVMSIDEFLELQKGEHKSKIDLIIGKLTRPSSLKKTMIFSLSFYLRFQEVVYASGEDIQKLNLAVNKLLNIFRYFGKFICLFFCFAEIIKSLAEGDVKSIGKIILKYSIAFSSFYFLPWLFEIIRSCFEIGGIFVAETLKRIYESLRSIIRFFDYLVHPNKILISTWNWTVKISFTLCMLISLISLLAYLLGNKKYGKCVSGSILVYTLIQAINSVF